jgi:TolB-like protein
MGTSTKGPRMADRAEPEDSQGPTDSAQAAVHPAHVFISYASSDAAIASALVEDLERHGIACWIAPRDVDAGALYADAIVRAIGAARAFVLVLSENSIDSSHVGKEVERASSKKRPIFVLRIDAAPLTPALEYFLSESQWLDAQAGKIEPAYTKLIGALRKSAPTTPGTVAGETPSAGTAPAAQFRGRRNRILFAAGLAAIAVAIAALLADKFWLAPHDTAEQRTTAAANPVSDKSIAVLPFTDMSEKKDQEYFADGMAEEVLDLLAKLPGIRVIGRTSSFQFKGKTEDLRTIGRTLGAAYVVEGSVRKSGDRLRVTAQLIGTHDGSHVWSGSYDENFGDVLKIQDRMAAGIVRALQITVGADELQTRPLLKNSEAYDLYLRGRYAFDRFDKAGFETAAGYFQQALALEPSYVHAAEWLAWTHEFMSEWGYVPPREGFELARRSAQRALVLNPGSGDAHAVLVGVHVIYDWDWSAAAEEGRLARQFAPQDPEVLVSVSDLARALGHADEAAGIIDSAFIVDPLFAAWHESLGNIRYRTGRLTEAEAELRKTLEISPTYASGHFYLGQILLAQGKLDAALLQMQQEAPDEGRDTGLAIVYHAMQRRPESDTALARLTKERAGEAAFEIAQVHAYRGELDQAFTWLNRAFDQKDIELFLIKGDPLLKNLEGDPRYKAFLQKMNLPE